MTEQLHVFKEPPPEWGVLTWFCENCGKSTYNPSEIGVCLGNQATGGTPLPPMPPWPLEEKIMGTPGPAPDAGERITVCFPCLDIGCGPAKTPGAIGLDRHPFPGVDVVRDLRRGLPWGDSHFSSVFAKHVLEHFIGEDLIFIVEEMWRVTIPGGTLTVVVPDASSPNRYRDPTHLTRDWSADSFMFWEVDDQGKYKIFHGPDYCIRAQLRLRSTAVNANADRAYVLEVVK